MIKKLQEILVLLFNLTIYAGMAILLDTTMKLITFINSHPFTKIESTIIIILIGGVYAGIAEKIKIKIKC